MALVVDTLVGAAVEALLSTVIEKRHRAVKFRPTLEKLESTLTRLKPLIDQIENFNRKLDRPKEETQGLINQMNKGAKLVLKCSKVQWWQFCYGANYHEELEELNRSIQSFFDLDNQVLNTRDTREILVWVREIQDFMVPSNHRVELRGMCSPPQPPAFTVGLDVPLKQLKLKLLQDQVGVPAVLTVTGPGGSGKSTLAKKLCWDDQVKASMNMLALDSGIIKFNGLNYADWSEQIHFQLGVMDLDLALVINEKSAEITETSTEENKSLYEAWERSNRLSLNLMRMTMDENVKPLVPKTDSAKEFMLKIKEYSQSNITDKSIVSNLMDELTAKKFEWSQPIHDHVTRMENIAAKLKSMGMDVSESFLVQFIMNSLPPEFGQFQENYNTLKEKWNFQEIKTMLVQEEGRLKKIKDHSLHLTFRDGSSSNKTKPSKKCRKDRASLKIREGQIHKEQRCFFCRKAGHMKKDCLKRKKWFEKKEIPFDPAHKGN